MKFTSTRDDRLRVSAAQAIVRGLSEDGGLFVPEAFPALDWRALAPLDYAGRAAMVLAAYIGDVPCDELLAMARAAYSGFGAPVAGNLIELFHGPTLAFKDMALQILPRLLAASKRVIGEERESVILVATSGDTGKAALEGFAGQAGVRVIVFFPEGGVSEAQRLQMVTQEGENVRAVAVRGNFDDAQAGVKRIFASPEMASALSARGALLSSANSINLGRLLPQIAYYFSAYADIVARGDVAPGAPLNVCVPTGNFGNILAAEYARRMGLPLGRLICASNQNHVLADFLKTGAYDRRREFHLTSSPSMDILVSSNLERMLFEISGRSAGRVRGWMADLQTKGAYALAGAELDSLRERFYGGWASEARVAETIRAEFAQNGRAVDPHTAVGLSVLAEYREKTGDGTYCAVAATASPYKFGRAVYRAISGVDEPDEFAACEALARLTGERVPEAILTLRHKPVLHTAVCAPDKMEQIVLEEKCNG